MRLKESVITDAAHFDDKFFRLIDGVAHAHDIDRARIHENIDNLLEFVLIDQLKVSSIASFSNVAILCTIEVGESLS